LVTAKSESWALAAGDKKADEMTKRKARMEKRIRVVILKSV
jgi:hypothetical protein